MPGSKLKEFARLSILGLAAAWLLHPFATSRMYGAGDALWYANMLADFVTQLRAGVFPIFVGQTQFAFNGAVYPIRVAPMYQHLAGFLDIVTGHALGFIPLQHLTVIVCGVAGIYASYLTLCRIAPNRRWSAAGFAILYVSCPGILGTIYTQDLYMTWMTVPLAPLAVYGMVRTFRKDDFTSQLWLAAPLAALWWAHSPIALWFTIIAAASQGIRLISMPANVSNFKHAAVGLIFLVILAQYPFVSLAEIKTPGVASNVVGTLPHPEKILGIVRSAFPAELLPLSPHARELSDLQLGYALWAILLLSAFSALMAPRSDVVILLLASMVLLTLVTPIPCLTKGLWHLIPASVVRITYYWPMQRFYLIASALLVAAGQITIASTRSRVRQFHRLFSGVLIVGCAWSVFESRQFIRAASERLGTVETTSRIQRSENLFLMDHAYGLFEKLPSYFSNGVLDPRSEARLISPVTGKVLSYQGATIGQRGVFMGTVDQNPGILDLHPSIHLEYGHRYELEFAFAQTNVTGILQFVGHSMFREYSLPSSGESLAFGDSLLNGKSVDLWTTDTMGDDVIIRFIPMLPGSRPNDFTAFGSFNFSEIKSSQEAVSVTSLLPFSARVVTSTPSMLETPRVFIPGYYGFVDGERVTVLRSQEGLAEISVPTGRHFVSISYKGPLLLRFSYWLAISTWASVFFSTILIGLSRKVYSLSLDN